MVSSCITLLHFLLMPPVGVFALTGRSRARCDRSCAGSEPHARRSRPDTGTRARPDDRRLPVTTRLTPGTPAPQSAIRGNRRRVLPTGERHRIQHALQGDQRIVWSRIGGGIENGRETEILQCSQALGAAEIHGWCSFHSCLLSRIYSLFRAYI